MTIKGYDDRFKLYHLGFPNEEVEEGFTNYLFPFYVHVGEEGGSLFVGNFIKDWETGRVDEFMKRILVMLDDTSYKIVGDAELYFQNAFYLITKMLGFYTEVERTIVDGRIDMVVKTKSYIYIIEFKYDKTAEEALRQIDERSYAKPFALDSRKLIKIGVNFSKEKRCIDDWKVVEG